jgi:hypothetical protein
VEVAKTLAYKNAILIKVFIGKAHGVVFILRTGNYRFSNN